MVKYTPDTVYAFYRGEELESTGTLPELVEATGLSGTTLEFYRYPSAQERLKVALIKIGGKEGEQTVITRRTDDRFAPVPTDAKYLPEKPPVRVKMKPVPMREFKFTDKWINYQLKGMFRGWK